MIQLVNARDPQRGFIIPFDSHLEQMRTSLSTLAAVALENYQREARLRSELEALRIEIDEERKARAVSELTDTDFFRELEAKIKPLRQRMGRIAGNTSPAWRNTGDFDG